MKRLKEINYYKWSVEKGDYIRDEETTTTYQRKKYLIKKIKTAIKIIVYFLLISMASYLIIAFV